MTGIVIASTNGKVGTEASVEVLRAGGSALDAVVAGARLVEADPNDHTVGRGGIPNFVGDIELDASVMEGRGLRSGAVAALQGYQDATDLARAVMDQLPHVLIAGDGARRLASEVGLDPAILMTNKARRIWRRRMRNEECVPEHRRTYTGRVRQLVGQMTSDAERATEEEPLHGTVNFIARDRAGDIAVAVSTSGWGWKYPGRVGDSPIIGAGNYADNRWGAAACTGRGEMAQRCCTAHSVVTFMRFGMPLDDALRMAIGDLAHLDDPYASDVHVIALDAAGNPAAASTAADKTYVVMTEEMPSPDERPRQHVPLPAKD